MANSKIIIIIIIIITFLLRESIKDWLQSLVTIFLIYVSINVGGGWGGVGAERGHVQPRHIKMLRLSSTDDQCFIIPAC